MEERLGKVGRPFTTLLVIAVGLGIIGWGFRSFYTTVIGPILAALGVEVAASLAEAIVGWAALFALLSLSFYLLIRGLRRLPERGSTTRIRQLESENAELRTAADKHSVGEGL